MDLMDGVGGGAAGKTKDSPLQGAERINRMDFSPQSDVWVGVASTCQ